MFINEREIFDIKKITKYEDFDCVERIVGNYKILNIEVNEKETVLKIDIIAYRLKQYASEFSLDGGATPKIINFYRNIRVKNELIPKILKKFKEELGSMEEITLIDLVGKIGLYQFFEGVHHSFSPLSESLENMVETKKHEEDDFFVDALILYPYIWI